MQIIEDECDLAYGLEQLIRIDPRFETIAEQSGPLPQRSLPTGFVGLANIIVSQMVSRASANAIWARMEERPAVLSAEGYAQISLQDARSFGLSEAKHKSLHNLANQLIAGAVDLDELPHMDGESAHRSLTALKGIGPWTADVYLLFALQHVDVFPAGDVALQAAAAHAFSLEHRPNERELKAMSVTWKPWRSIAARALWAYYSLVVKRSLTPLP